VSKKEQKLEYVLGVLDKFSEPLRRYNALVEGAVAPIRKVQKATRALGKEAGAERLSKAFHGVREAAGDVVENLGKIGLGIAGSIAGGFYALQQTAQDLTQISAQAASVGASTRDLQAFGAAVKDMGLNTENVVDLMEEMNNKIGESKGLEATTPVKESLKMLGLEFDKIAKLDPAQQFEEILDAAAKLDDAQISASAIDMLMGGEGNKIMGHLRARAEAEGKSVRELIAEYKKMNLLTAEGEAGLKKFNTASNSLLSVMGSGWQELLGLVGEKLAPLLQKITNWAIQNFGRIKAALSGWLDSFDADAFLKSLQEWGKKLEWIWDLIGGFKGALVAVGLVLAGPLLLAITTLTVAVAKLGLVILATPVGWIMAAIAAVAAAVYLIIRNWDSIAAFFSGLWGRVVEGFQSFVAMIGALWDGVLGIFTSVGDGR